MEAGPQAPPPGGGEAAGQNGQSQLSNASKQYEQQRSGTGSGDDRKMMSMLSSKPCQYEYVALVISRAVNDNDACRPKPVTTHEIRSPVGAANGAAMEELNMTEAPS